MDSFIAWSAVGFVVLGLMLFAFGFLLGRRTERDAWTAALNAVDAELRTLRGKLL